MTQEAQEIMNNINMDGYECECRAKGRKMSIDDINDKYEAMESMEMMEDKIEAMSKEIDEHVQGKLYLEKVIDDKMRLIDDLLRTNSELVFQIEALRKSCLEMCETIDNNCDHLVEEHERVLKLEKALTKIRDCDFVISLPDRMDAVREIAREALAKEEG